jgi:monovalent cation:proton antiporter-2 (CPA2) family protein
MTSDPLLLAIIYLAAMVLTVPFAKKWGLGIVLGYLIAGVILGPSVTGVLGKDQEAILHFAEFGVIMMLFMIGLELKPSLLWRLRGPIFGLGTLQVVATTVAFCVLGLALDFTWQVSLTVGMIVSLSSTAIVISTLQEKGLMKTPGGDAAFAVLLFQDIAVIPILAVLPLLAPVALSQAGDTQSGALQAFKIVAAVVAVILAGKFLVRPVFRLVGNSKLRELFTAMGLLLVLAVAALMHAVGLSPALGAFLGGVVLADSEYRHQLEVDIDPFKGLLLGVFFISVGAGIQFDAVMANPGFVLFGLASILLLKFLVLLGVGRLGKLGPMDLSLFALSMAQGGEFAFVLINFSRQNSLFEPLQAQLLTASVALSMFLAPLLIQFHLKVMSRRWVSETPKREADTIDESHPVIIAGFGRFGQMVGRLLRSAGFGVTILDFDSEQIEVVRKFGTQAYFGDATQKELLHAAGATSAKLLVIAMDNSAKVTELVELVKEEYPHLQILVRAYDRLHAYELIQKGVSKPYIETSGSALQMGIDALRSLGYNAHQAYRAAQLFNRHNDESIQALAKVYGTTDQSSFMSHARDWVKALESVLSKDGGSLAKEVDEGWEGAPRPTRRELSG